MMAEAAQVADIGKDGEGQDGTDARQLLKALEVGIVPEMERSSLFQSIVQLADHLAEHNPEHRNRFRVLVDG